MSCYCFWAFIFLHTAILYATVKDTLANNDLLHDKEDEYTITVTGKQRSPQLEAPYSYSLIQAEEWTGTNKSIADVVSEQSGVQTRRFGGQGSFQTVSIRGVPGDKVLVLLDGIPLNSAMGGAVDLSAINTERINEIEVFKGITPSRFGGGGLGGVVNIKSKIGSKWSNGSAQASIGAYGNKKYSLELSSPISEKTVLFSSLNHVDAINNWPYINRNKTPYNKSDDRIDKVENNHYRFVEGRAHITSSIINNRTFLSGISYSSSELGIPGSEGSLNRTAKYSQDILTLNSKLGYNEQSKTVFSFTPEIGFLKWNSNTFWTSLDKSIGTFHGTIASTPNSHGEAKSVLDVLNASTLLNFAMDSSLSADLFIETKLSQIATETRAAGFPHGDWPGNSQEASTALDMYFRKSIFKMIWNMSIGGRVAAVRSATRGGRNSVFEMEIHAADTVEFPWSLHAGIQCRPSEKTNIFVNSARYVKLPSLRQKYGSNGAVIPNPGLKSEHGTTHELGVRYYTNSFFAEASMFSTTVSNSIVMLSDGSMTKPVNLAGSHSYGLEWLISGNISTIIKTEIRGTLQQALNQARLYNYYGKQLPNEPELSLLGKVVIKPAHHIDFIYWLDYKSPFFRDFGNTIKVPDDEEAIGLFYHNVQLKWKISNRLDADFSIRNINGAAIQNKEMVTTSESGYSWILYPSNEWNVSLKYHY